MTLSGDVSDGKSGIPPTERRPTLNSMPAVVRARRHALRGVSFPHPSRLGAGFSALRDALPRGHTLPDEIWARRHRGIVWLLWLHAAGFAVVGTLKGYGPLHGAGHAVPLALFALLARHLAHRRKLAAAIASTGLITASALLVHMWGGVIEGHFHFFVMIAVITLYEDWVPFLLAFVYVVGHHGLVGAYAPSGVYNHASAVAHPWRWALIHGVFVVSAGAANVVAWRLNEDVRAARTRDSERRAEESEKRFRSIFEGAPLGIVLWDLDGRVVQGNRKRAEMLRLKEGDLRERSYADFTHPEDRGAVRDLLRELTTGTRNWSQLEKRDVRSDGTIAWTNLTVSVVRDAAGQPQFAIGMAEDISNRKDVEREREALLERKREQVERLREVDRLKDDFVASVSHELRTPLTSICGYVDLLREGEGGTLTPEQDALLEIVDRNSGRLLRLVADLLEVAQLESGQLSLDPEQVDLRELVDDCVQRAQALARMRELDLAFDVDSAPSVHGDRSRLGQVVDNLLSNALKFTPAGGRVRARIGERNGAVVFEVEDTGVGIPAADHQYLFDRFYRTERASTLAIPGTGLGLWITRQIVQAHGGEIDVVSDDGVGTTFTVTLPVADVRPERPLAA
jgi:PAS domain S-box-containing protein